MLAASAEARGDADSDLSGRVGPCRHSALRCCHRRPSLCPSPSDSDSPGLLSEHPSLGRLGSWARKALCVRERLGEEGDSERERERERLREIERASVDSDRRHCTPAAPGSAPHTSTATRIMPLGPNPESRRRAHPSPGPLGPPDGRGPVTAVGEGQQGKGARRLGAWRAPDSPASVAVAARATSAGIDARNHPSQPLARRQSLSPAHAGA